MMTTPDSESAASASSGDASIRPASSLRTPRPPLIPRRVWILGVQSSRVDTMQKALEEAGHEVRTAATGAELAPSLREFRPHLILIDMDAEHDKGRHVATQLRADRATRQVPIILVGARGVTMKSADKPITGPSRRYTGALDAPSVIKAVLTELL
jgi:CheY-like chemotaxis protein